jgi:propionyl-CoA synthetase
VVTALPKTRSGKILRKTMRGIADGRDEPVPSWRNAMNLRFSA